VPDRFCPSCGTEVESDARFCPSCGTTLHTDEPDEAIPPAPAWPEPAQVSESEQVSEPEPFTEPEPTPEAADEPTRTDWPPAGQEPMTAWEPEPPPPAAPPPPPMAAADPPPAASAPAQPSAELPFTWPTLLSGWLIGAGAVVGALALIPRLAGAGYLVSLLLFLALLGIAATIFLADHVPAVPRLRLIVLCTTLIGLGVGLARAAFTIQGIDTLFLVAMLAAAGGAVLIELDRDRPFPPPARSGS
jgi:hypothetical protein